MSSPPVAVRAWPLVSSSRYRHPGWSAVLTYRPATYWLPVLPGWLSWRLLRHRDYV